MDVNARLKEKLHSKYRYAVEINKILDIISVPMQDMVDILLRMISKKTISEKSGDDLDKAASRIGVKRPYAQEPQEHLFALVEEGEVDNGDFYNGFSDENDPESGGYLADEIGLPLIADPSQKMDDVKFRALIEQKAASLRKGATITNLFNYLLAFGTRCNVNDDEKLHLEYDPLDYYAVDNFYKWYIINKGFKPAGISTEFRANMRNGELI